MTDCDRFQQRFQHRLDRGQPLDDDRLLRQHASRCDDCRADLDAWRQISRSIDHSAGSRRHDRRRARFRSAAAAAALLAGVLWYSIPPGRDPLATRPAPTPAAEPMLIWADAGGSLASSPWLGQWTDAVAEPLVPIGEGVRPLARGFRSALGLLIIPGHSPAPVDDSSPSPAQAITPCLANPDAYV